MKQWYIRCMSLYTYSSYIYICHIYIILIHVPVITWVYFQIFLIMIMRYRSPMQINHAWPHSIQAMINHLGFPALMIASIIVWWMCVGTRLTYWGRVTHICISKLTIIGSDNGLLLGRCQAIVWTSAGILLIRPLGTNFSEILIEIHTFLFKKMLWKMASGKWRPFCLCLNVLTKRS